MKDIRKITKHVYPDGPTIILHEDGYKHKLTKWEQTHCEVYLRRASKPTIMERFKKLLKKFLP